MKRFELGVLPYYLETLLFQKAASPSHAFLSVKIPINCYGPDFLL